MQVPLEARRVREGPSLSLWRNQPCPHVDVSPHPAISASHSVLQTCQEVSMWVCYHVDDRPTPVVAGSLPGASRLCSLRERQPQPVAMTHHLPSSRAMGFSRGRSREWILVERPQRKRARESFKQEETRAIVNLKGRASVWDVGTECGPAGVASGHPAPRP